MSTIVHSSSCPEMELLNAGSALDAIVISPPSCDHSTCAEGTVACSDFIVQFPYTSQRRSKRIHVQINGRNIAALNMTRKDDGTCRFLDGNSFKPRSSTLESLIRNKILHPGKNFIKYIWTSKDATKQPTAEAFLYLWSSADSVIVSDIDGTVTQSDVMGVFDTIIAETYEHAHPGVCQLYSELAWKHKTVRFMYLTSRPIRFIVSTRKFIEGLSQRGREGKCKLPPGPIFCHTGGLATVLVSELIKKDVDSFKADVLSRQVVLPFAAAGRKEHVFVAAFGNKKTDAMAYEKVGIDLQDIYIINKKSEIMCLDRCEDVTSSMSSDTGNAPFCQSLEEFDHQKIEVPRRSSYKKALSTIVRKSSKLTPSLKRRSSNESAQTFEKSMDSNNDSFGNRSVASLSMKTSRYRDPLFDSYHDPKLFSALLDKINEKLRSYGIEEDDDLEEEVFQDSVELVLCTENSIASLVDEDQVRRNLCTKNHSVDEDQVRRNFS